MTKARATAIESLRLLTSWRLLSRESLNPGKDIMHSYLFFLIDLSFENNTAENVSFARSLIRSAALVRSLARSAALRSLAFSWERVSPYTNDLASLRQISCNGFFYVCSSVCVCICVCLCFARAPFSLSLRLSVRLTTSPLLYLQFLRYIS